MTAMPGDITWHHGTVGRGDRERRNGHKGVTLWMTGLSASGKSTMAVVLEERIFSMDCQVMVLDGDNVRHGINSDLGFSREDREENIRRVAELAKLLTSKGIITIASFISPYRSDRSHARSLHDNGDFVEVFIDCPLDVCEARDPKGLYKKARAGQLSEFTGIDDPYEPPDDAEVVLDTWRHGPHECAEQVIVYLRDKGYLGDGVSEE